MTEIIIHSHWQVIGFLVTCLFVFIAIYRAIETIETKLTINEIKFGYKTINDQFIQNCQVL